MPSPERPLAGDNVASGPPVARRFVEPELDERRPRLVLSPNDLQSEPGKARLRPSAGLLGIGDDERASGREEPDGALGGHGRWTERAGHDEPEVAAPSGVPRQDLGPPVEDLHAVFEVQLADSHPEMVHSPLLRVEQREVNSRPRQRQHETREPAARAEVQHPLGRRRDEALEGPRVINLLRDGRGPEEPELPGPLERRDQRRR